ncbi:MAG: HAMP domain-containing histidine kinase [Lachnospiraceae bacterium]|nr:HAMP domain-containing histidine kinase [Lachnospiraceae bacterium]
MTQEHQLKALKKTIEEQRIAISQISHEIRNPVTLINGSLNLIEKQHPEVRDFAFWNDVKRDMTHLLNLLEDVSHYNNSMLLHPELLNTSHWLKEVTASLNFLLPKPFHFSSHIPQDLPEIHADSTKLCQALHNLIRNGFESLEGDGTVSLAASANGRYLSIRISDTGCGIPAEYIDSLFQPFTTHKPNGTGLGLAITKRIIEAHHGQLLLETDPGTGTCFTILLPLT